MRRQEGQAILFTLIVIVLATAGIFFGLYSSKNLTLEADKRTVAALAQAREALIGYATAHSSRPGSLPCPDDINTGSQRGNCNTASLRIGRLPWRTLGIPDLRDGSGERLWYAVSNTFKNSTATGTLNSDAIGDFTVDGVPGVIAVIFAPGPALATQIRDAANINNVSSYLDGGNQSGMISMSFVSSGNTNDKFLALTKEGLFPSVERRVLREIGNNLKNYYSGTVTPSPPWNNRYYPYPAPFTGSTECDSTTPIYRGRIPLSCPPLAGLTLPTWFSTNRWNEVIVYAVAPQCTPKIDNIGVDFSATPETSFASPILGKFCIFLGFYFCYPYIKQIDTSRLNCTNSGGYLTVTGSSSSVEAILFAAGPSLNNQVRPCSTANNCLEDAQNYDSPDDFIYSKPQKSIGNNDSMLIVGPSGL